ncbi:MAG: ABC transporter substrate-binding protein [Xanthomonadaceae bacterium]|nr:ABC transporter substrate-binding protein [Xanthomonadaceae bacterium]
MKPLIALRRLAWLGMVAFSFASAQNGVAPADASGPEVAHSLERALIDSMKAGESLSFQQRYARLEPVIVRSLDVARMARFIFGSKWREFTAEEQDGFLEAFTTLSVSTYAARFDEHKGERFDPVSETGQGDDRMLIRSRFTKGSGDTVVFDYMLMRADGQWRVVNILTDGISDLALKRSQYGALHGKGGMEAVLASIDRQIQRLHER